MRWYGVLLAALVLIGLLSEMSVVSAQLFPTNPFPTQPTPAAAKPPSVYADFQDTWGRSSPDFPTAFAVIVREYGLVTVVWRTGDEPDGTIARGQATGYLKTPQGSIASGVIGDTTDAAVIAGGPIALELIGEHKARLTQQGRVWTLCSAAYAADVIASGQPEPPCDP